MCTPDSLACYQRGNQLQQSIRSSAPTPCVCFFCSSASYRRHLMLSPNEKTQKVIAIKRTVTRMTCLITRGEGVAPKCYGVTAPRGRRCGGNRSSVADRNISFSHHLSASSAVTVQQVPPTITAASTPLLRLILRFWSRFSEFTVIDLFVHVAASVAAFLLNNRWKITTEQKHAVKNMLIYAHHCWTLWDCERHNSVFPVCDLYHVMLSTGRQKGRRPQATGRVSLSSRTERSVTASSHQAQAMVDPSTSAALSVQPEMMPRRATSCEDSHCRRNSWHLQASVEIGGG